MNLKFKKKIKKIEKLKHEIKDMPEKEMEFPPITEKPENFVDDLLDACESRDLPSIQWLIEKENEDPNQKDEFGNSLHYAIFAHNPTIVKYLISKGVDIEAKGFQGMTPLLTACKEDQLPIVQYLISKGANIEAECAAEICIHIAATKNSPKILKYLIEQQKMGVDTLDKEKRTPLHIACISGSILNVEYLISKGANIDATDKLGFKCIHYAVIADKLPVISYLIEDQNIDVDITDGNNTTPLFYATVQGNLSIVAYLVSKGANIIRECSFQGASCSSIGAAAMTGKLAIIQFLVESKIMKNTLKEDDLTYPLWIACTMNQLPIVDYLISKGANVNAKLTKDGSSPLHAASESGSIAIVRYLISKGANKYSQDNDGKTPSDYAKNDIIKDILK